LEYETKRTDIYFLGSYLCLRHFLSAWEPGVRTLILVNENANLVHFLRLTLPQGEVEIVELAEHSWGLRSFLSLIRLRRQLVRRLKAIQSPGKVTFFCNGYTLNFFMLIEELARLGWDVRFINAEPHLPLQKITPSLRLRTRLLLIRIFLRTHVDFAKNQWWVTFLYLRFSDSAAGLGILDWSDIYRKIEYQRLSIPQEGILFIDAPLQHYQGIDISRSQESLCRWIDRYIPKDMPIFLKAHPRAIGHSFTGTRLEKRVRLLPAFIPAEILLLERELCFLFTTSAVNAFTGRIISLAKALVFLDEEGQSKFWLHFKQCMTAKNIEVADFDTL
jgi:hypothetical protein